MKHAIYLPATTSLAELQAMIRQLEQLGLGAEQVSVGGSFEGWLEGLAPNSEAWIYSCGRFGSVNELLGVCEQLSARGIVLKSVEERWLNDPEVTGQALLAHLFRLGSSLHSTRTREGLQVAAAKGRRSGRPAGYRKSYTASDFADVDRVEALVSSQGISTAEACRRLGLSVYTYYRRRSLRRSHTL